MKNRILKGWTPVRGLFLIIGAFLLFESISRIEWVGIIMGSYAAIMGLFGLGCAGGKCYGGSCNYNDTPVKKDQEVK